MRFLHPEYDPQLELSTRDVFIVPRHFDGLSRQDCDLVPVDFEGGSHPVVTANMNAVTGKRMAEVVARYGGLGVLPQDMSIDTAARLIRHVKAAPVAFDTALSVSPETPVRGVLGIIRKRSHGLVVVVNEAKRPIGIVAPSDLRDGDPYDRVSERMHLEPITLRSGLSHEEAFAALERDRLKAAPVVDAEGRLLGVITREDTVRFSMQAPSLDRQGRLMVAAAVGISKDAADRAGQLLEAGADVLVLDTAHGHQRRMLESLQAVREAVGESVVLVAGNVCTEEGTEALIDAGADVVKVNVGPGAMCTTRIQTGAGRPTFSSVAVCAKAARARGKHVWADGGVRHPRDVALYLAAGASRVMVGSLFAGTYESPGELKLDRDERPYKENYGMASARAVRDRTRGSEAFQQAKQALFREGISTSKIYLKPGLESAGAMMFDIITGVRSALTYAGTQALESFHREVLIGVQTASGYQEGTPHGAVWK